MQPLGTQEEKNFCLGGDLALPAQSELVLLSGEGGVLLQLLSSCYSQVAGCSREEQCPSVRSAGSWGISGDCGHSSLFL